MDRPAVLGEKIEQELITPLLFTRFNVIARY